MHWARSKETSGPAHRWCTPSFASCNPCRHSGFRALETHLPQICRAEWARGWWMTLTPSLLGGMEVCEWPQVCRVEWGLVDDPKFAGWNEGCWMTLTLNLYGGMGVCEWPQVCRVEWGLLDDVYPNFVGWNVVGGWPDVCRDEWGLLDDAYPKFVWWDVFFLDDPKFVEWNGGWWITFTLRL